MPAVNGENVGFMATQKELDIIDEMKKLHYNETKAEVIRMLINAGARALGLETAEKAEQ